MTESDGSRMSCLDSCAWGDWKKVLRINGENEENTRDGKQCKSVHIVPSTYITALCLQVAVSKTTEKLGPGGPFCAHGRRLGLFSLSLPVRLRRLEAAGQKTFEVAF